MRPPIGDARIECRAEKSVRTDARIEITHQAFDHWLADCRSSNDVARHLRPARRSCHARSKVVFTILLYHVLKGIANAAMDDDMRLTRFTDFDLRLRTRSAAEFAGTLTVEGTAIAFATPLAHLAGIVRGLIGANFAIERRRACGGAGRASRNWEIWSPPLKGRPTGAAP